MEADSNTFALMTRWRAAKTVFRRIWNPTQTNTNPAIAKLPHARHLAGSPSTFSGSINRAITASTTPMIPRRRMNVWSASSVANCWTSDDATL